MPFRNQITESDNLVENAEPAQQLSRMISGYWISQAVYVAAKLKIADQLANGSQSLAQLADATETHEPSLYRLLRALASVGVFAEQDDGSFTSTPKAECLRSDVPGSQWAMAVMMGEEHYRAWGNLLHSVETGEIAFDKVFGKPIFDHLSENPESAAIFDQAMTSVHGRETEPMVDAYDFSDINTIADIGGGNGTVIAAILKRYPNMSGILFDLPHVIERAQPNLEAAGVVERCRSSSGDFFESVPVGADAYLMRHIIHDWDNDKAATILRNCHEALNANGRVLIVESVIAPGNDPSFAKLLDLTMMVLPGGKERTADEYRALLEASGFTLSRIVPTNTDVSIIEGRKGS